MLSISERTGSIRAVEVDLWRIKVEHIFLKLKSASKWGIGFLRIVGLCLETLTLRLPYSVILSALKCGFYIQHGSGTGSRMSPVGVVHFYVEKKRR